MATPPTRVSYNVPTSGNFSSTTSPKTTASFDVVSGDLIVVLCSIESAFGASSVTPSASGGSVTWTSRATQNAGGSNQSAAYCWTGAVGATATGITVSLNRPSTDTTLFWGMSATLWRDHGGVGTTFSGNNGTGSGAPSTAGAANCAANSAVMCQVNDWNAADGASRVWRTINGAAESESTYYRDSARHTAYGGYRTDTGAAAAITQGLTAPSTQRWVLVGVEVLGTTGGTSHTVTQTDPAGTTDTTALDQAKVHTDAAGLTDTTTLELSQTVTATDSAGLTDTTQLARGIGLTANDTEGLTDSIAVSRDQVTTDGAGLTDSITTSRDIASTATDAAGLTDSVTIDNGKAVTQADSAGATDTTTLDRGQVSTDTTGLADSVSLALSRPISDTAGLTDAVSVENGKLVGATDTAGLTDSVVLERFTAITDDPGLSDLAAMTRGTVITETTGLTDTVVTSLVPAGGLVTPAERTFTVPAESRVLVVKAENRVLVVPSENRTLEA